MCQYWYIFNLNAMIIITSREFRDKQKKLLEKADQGEQLVITRQGRFYALVPLTKEDLKLDSKVGEKAEVISKELKKAKTAPPKAPVKAQSKAIKEKLAKATPTAKSIQGAAKVDKKSNETSK